MVLPRLEGSEWLLDGSWKEINGGLARLGKRWGAGEHSWQGVTKSTWATIVFCLGALELGEVGVHPDHVFCLSEKISLGSDSLVTVVTSSLQISVVS